MLEKPTNNTAHANVVTDSANPRPQSANSTDQKINFHACLRCTIQCRDHILVEQGVHLGNDSRRPAQPRVIAFPRNQVEAVLRNVDG